MTLIVIRWCFSEGASKPKGEKRLFNSEELILFRDWDLSQLIGDSITDTDAIRLNNLLKISQ